MVNIPFLSLVSLYGIYLRYSLSSAGLSSQTISLDDDHQTTIHFWGPKKSLNSTKPVLILIHGFGPHGVWQWQKQAVFFSRNFDVYIPDLVFFGDSFTESPERSEVFQAVCVGKLLEKIGLERYTVVGTSYGGFVAYRMAEMWGERVEKVVIASSGVNMRREENVELLRRAKMEKIEQLMLPNTPSQLRTEMRLVLYRHLYVPDFLLSDIIHKLYSENRKEKMELLNGLTLGRDNSVNISPLQQEVLIVWGDHDEIFLPEKAIQLKQLLGENARLEMINKTSHVPQLENPRQFNHILNNFLGGPP